MKEVWKDIKNYEGLYQVSNLGNVRSIDRYKEINDVYVFISQYRINTQMIYILFFLWCL